MDERRRSTMRGFTLLEAVVSLAILAGAVLAFTSAVLGSAHATTDALAHQALTDVATDVLTDLRVAVAYQPEVADALYRHPPAPFTVARANPDGTSTAIVVRERLVPLVASPGYDVSVRATMPDGRSESVRQIVTQQAAAPGSIVTAAPTATPATGSSGAGP